MKVSFRWNRHNTRVNTQGISYTTSINSWPILRLKIRVQKRVETKRNFIFAPQNFCWELPIHFCLMGKNQLNHWFKKHLHCHTIKKECLFCVHRLKFLTACSYFKMSNFTWTKEGVKDIWMFCCSQRCSR